MKYARIAQQVFNSPLLVAPHRYRAILEVLSPRMGIEGAAGLFDFPHDAEMAKLANQLPSSGLLMPRTQADDERPMRFELLPGGVALIQVVGTLVHRLDLFDALSGMTSYQQIEAQFIQALDSSKVSSIVLEIDSGGGQAAGTFALADLIYESRGEKQITAVINEHAYSAAYAIASAADRIVIPKSGGAGSIGVIATHVDMSKHNEQEGYKVKHITAGARKADGSPHFPLSEEAEAWLQESVNDTYELFVETVARNRGLSVAAVRGTEAAVYTARNALSIGLVDEIAPAAKVVQALVDGEIYDTTRRVSMSDEKTKALVKKMMAQVAFAKQLGVSVPEVDADTPEDEAALAMDGDEFVNTVFAAGRDSVELPEAPDTEAAVLAAAKQAGITVPASATGLDAIIKAVHGAGEQAGRETAQSETIEHAKAISAMARQANRSDKAMAMFIEGLSQEEARARLLAELSSQERIDSGLDPKSTIGGSTTPVINSYDVYSKRKAGAQR